MYTGKIWIAIWTLIYILSFQLDCFALLSNHGINIIGNEYYRFFTGLLVHVNLFHLTINIISLICVLHFLKDKIHDFKIMFISIFIGILTNLIFSIIYPDSFSIGGSPVIFGIIAVTAVLWIFKKELYGFKPYTTICGRWIIGYAILSNVPIFSNNASTLVVHMIAFTVGLALGAIGIKTKFL